MANETRTLSRRTPSEPSTFRPFATPSAFRPFAMLRDMTEWMDQFFEGDLPITRGERMWAPTVEVKEKDNNMVVSADLPGIDPKDVKVELDENNLVIQGERKRDETRETEGYRRSERYYGSFFRAVPLPDYAKADQAKADFKNGVLEVTVPIDQSKSGRKQIPISTK